jgi:TRAF3-interacting protein 1
MADLDALVKDTVKTVGRCISKPPMAPKLLVKPPFRFLHDVVTEVRVPL